MEKGIGKLLEKLIIDELGFLIVKDQQGNVIYPLDNATIIALLSDSITTIGNEIYIPKTNTWYQKTIQQAKVHKTIYIIEIYKEITKQKDLLQELSYDYTTKLLVKNIAYQNIFQYFDKIAVSKEDFAIVIGDIDLFKHFNDIYGHNVGDLVLKEVAQTIETQITKQQNSKNLCTRIGGEEFLILLTNISKNDAYQKIEELRHQIEKIALECCTDSPSILTMSFGIYHVKEFANQLKQLGSKEVFLEQAIEKADKALYCSKNNGRNKTTIYTNME